MKLTINGEAQESAAADIAALIEVLGLPAAAMLVEHNGTALRREEWRGCQLAEGDQIEIIRIVAGG